MRKNVPSAKQLRLLKRHLMQEVGEETRQDIAAKQQEPFRLRRKKQETQVKEEEEVGVKEKVKVEKEPISAEKMAPIPTYDVIKTKLNMVRSGKSLDDEAVGSQLQAYFDELTDAEKLGMYAYLEAFAEIISGGAAGEKVDEPSDSPYQVKMILKRPGSGEEDTKVKSTQDRVAIATDTPIVVGESARNKSTFKKLLIKNHR